MRVSFVLYTRIYDIHQLIYHLYELYLSIFSDVRNAYESDIGHFKPPEGGATLLDPKMRTSQDFPKWLNAPETKEKLKDKTVMMYCTGKSTFVLF